VFEIKQKVLFAFLAAVTPACPWGFTGHHVVAIIAEQRLTPEAREEVRKLLMDGKYTMPQISACADELRDGGRGRTPTPEQEMCRQLAGEVPSTASTWHYIDIPVPVAGKDLEKYCPDHNCVVDRITLFRDILRNSTVEAQRRAALLFLIHFYGDIHQPLHCAERTCDRGGNSERVIYTLNGKESQSETLHKAWDVDDVEQIMSDARITDEREFANRLNTDIGARKARKWARATVEQIAWEGNALAIKKAYRGIPFQDFCAKPQPQPIVTKLAPRYEKDEAKVAREQLMKAGVRLAAALNEAFSPKSNAPKNTD
jgi:hypothetical protein